MSGRAEEHPLSIRTSHDIRNPFMCYHARCDAAVSSNPVVEYPTGYASKHAGGVRVFRSAMLLLWLRRGCDVPDASQSKVSAGKNAVPRY